MIIKSVTGLFTKNIAPSLEECEADQFGYRNVEFASFRRFSFKISSISQSDAISSRFQTPPNFAVFRTILFYLCGKQVAGIRM